jgi:predicted nucleic acid-binding protein
MSGLVLDASAAVALLRGEPAAGEIRRELRVHAGESIHVPGLFWLEAVNVLAHRYRYPPDAIVEAVYELEQIGAVTADVGRPETLAVVDALGRTGLTAYDAAYLVLAETTGARLLTLDADLAAAAGDLAILVGPRAVREGQVPYRVGVSWATWRGAAGYLAQLRRSIEA